LPHREPQGQTEPQRGDKNIPKILPGIFLMTWGVKKHVSKVLQKGPRPTWSPGQTGPPCRGLLGTFLKCIQMDLVRNQITRHIFPIQVALGWFSWPKTEFIPSWLTTRPPDVNSELQKLKSGFSEKTEYSTRIGCTPPGECSQFSSNTPVFPKTHPYAFLDFGNGGCVVWWLTRPPDVHSLLENPEKVYLRLSSQKGVFGCNWLHSPRECCRTVVSDCGVRRWKKSTYQNEPDVRKPLLSSISQGSKKLRLYKVV
jgi:hypothetical protein